ncbi:MAG: hypothetical protein WHS89_06875 [Acidimicrobiales bacterium]|jgi:hypothetical protein
MVSPHDRARPPTSPPSAVGDWPAQATDAIVNVVDQVRDKTTGPILTAARALVFGVMVVLLACVVLVLLLIAALRLLNEVLPTVWMTYLVVGAVLTIVGALVFRKRHAPPDL